MTVNRETKLKIKQLGVIIISWMMMGFLMTLYDHFVLLMGRVQENEAGYSFLISAARNIGAGLISALIGGSILVFYVNVKCQEKSQAYTFGIVSGSFILITILIITVIGLVFIPLETGRPLNDPVSKAAFRNFLADRSHIKDVMAWAFVVAITKMLLQVSSKFGQADFWNILRGKYNRPQEEKKIFMFLDLNSSTAIAEKLGDEMYHAFLRDFFADITTPILNNKGNVYQYVGDEVVIAWNYGDGKQNGNCVQCFFDMKVHIDRLGDKYFGRYGFVPSFKAGIHCGSVIAGEVGILKRDITYSGNVLNTTSRILGKCSELQEELIVSTDLLAQLCQAKNYMLRPLGAIKLRGREKEIQLNALRIAV
jgi:adenylate cyclase